MPATARTPVPATTVVRLPEPSQPGGNTRRPVVYQVACTRCDRRFAVDLAAALTADRLPPCPGCAVTRPDLA